MLCIVLCMKAISLWPPNVSHWCCLHITNWCGHSFKSLRILSVVHKSHKVSYKGICEQLSTLCKILARVPMLYLIHQSGFNSQYWYTTLPYYVSPHSPHSCKWNTSLYSVSINRKMLYVDSYPHKNPQDSHTGYTDEWGTYLVSEHRLEG